MTPETAKFYDDPHFWVAIAFVLFIGVFLKYILPPITKALDKRGADIAQQLELANRLRAEAEMLLAASKMQQEAVQQETKAILAQAEKDAKEITEKAATDLAQTMARRAAQTDEKIARATTDAIAQLRAQMIDVATQTARNVIIAKLKDQQDDPAINRALKSIERQIH